MSDSIGGISLDDIMAAAMFSLDDVPDKNGKEKDIVNSKSESDKHKNLNGLNVADNAYQKGKIQKADNGNIVVTAEYSEEEPDETEPYMSIDEFANRVESYDALLKSYNDLNNILNISSSELLLAFRDLSDQIITSEMDKFSLEPVYATYKGTDQGGVHNVTYPISFNVKKGFILSVITDDVSRNTAENFIQYIIFCSLNNHKKGAVRVRCLDYLKGGRSFGRFINLIEKNKLFGKKMYLDKDGQDNIIDDLDAICDNNISKLRGYYNSVAEYNKSHIDSAVPYTLSVFCDSDFSNTYSSELFQKIILNSKATAVSQIFLNTFGNENDYVTEKSDVVIFVKNNSFHLVNGNYSVPMFVNTNEYNDASYRILEEKLNVEEKTDNRIEKFINISDLPPFTLDSTEGLSVPFAYNDEKQVVNLEFGVETQAHGLISGSTGSGKSTTLHTIIEQTIYNYHPDDVEIWLVDCKAVEFGCYIKQRTPHITLIGQDNSPDFLISFVDLLKREYERRKKLFIEGEVKDLKEYRAKFGKRSISRLLIIVDEFHNLTQAVQNYSGEKNYVTILENLLKETRSMGMTFLFCSQTIATGLHGLTESAKQQIGCRLSMKHEDLGEISETLSIPYLAENQKGIHPADIKDFAKGQVAYKRIQQDGSFVLEKLNVLWITAQTRAKMIETINKSVEAGYKKRDEITHKDSQRYYITEKDRHPITKFINNGLPLRNKALTVYPAAPTALVDSYSISLDNEPGNNLLIIGSDDSLRESIILTSVMGILMDPQNKIVANILDDTNEDNIRINGLLKHIQSGRLAVNFGFEKVMKCISGLKKIRKPSEGRVIYLWYGLNKLKNAIYNYNQDIDDDVSDSEQSQEPQNSDQALSMILNAGFMPSQLEYSNIDEDTYSDNLKFEDCVNILQKLEEYGPDNDNYSITIYNTFKGMQKTGINTIANYEYIIGLEMSADDSFDLFGASNFTAAADENTAVLFRGNRRPDIIRPYLINADTINKFNNVL